MKKTLLKSSLAVLLLVIGTLSAAAGTFALTGSDPENKGVLSTFWGYATMSFDLNFGENVVIKKSSGVAAHLYKGDAATGTEITPDDDWRLNIGDASTSARLWAADYDAYTMSFEVDDNATYTLVVPAGIIANAAGDTNEELTLTFYGSEEAQKAAEGGSETTALALASSTPADGEQFTLSSGWADMGIYLTFNKDITVVSSSANVVLQQVGGSTVEPDDGWVVTKEGTNGVHIWGSDYDGFTCTFKPAEDASYTFTIPAGIVKDADGNLNEALTITVLGPVSEKPEHEGVTIDPEEGTVASLQNFTLTFANYQFVDIAADSYKGAAVLINDATKEETTTTVSYGTLLNQVKVALPEAVTAEGTYTLHIPAGKLYDGNSYDEDDLPELNFHYTIDGSVVPPVEEPEKVTADPADNSTVESLSSIRLTFDYDGSVYGNAEAGDITVTDDATGETVTTCTTTTTLVVYDNQIDVVLNDELTTAGSYTITFPAGRFTKGDMAAAEESKAFTLHYTVDTTLGINATTATDATEVLRVNAAGARMNSAQKGLNIVKMSDGTVRKVIVK